MTSHTGLWRKPLLNIAKTAATILLLVWLFRTFPMQDVFSRLRDMNWELVRCRYGNDANLIGALKLFFEQNPA
jgi:hypothetical protein